MTTPKFGSVEFKEVLAELKAVFDAHSLGVVLLDALERRLAEQLVARFCRNIEPFVTLLHFTHPRWFHETSPWHLPGSSAVERFHDFVEMIARRLGDRVRYWTVLNEPNVWLAAAHLAAACPPGVKGLRHLWRAGTALLRAHRSAYASLKLASRGDAQVGIAHNVLAFEPSRHDRFLDRWARDHIARHYNHAFLRALTSGSEHLDPWPSATIARAQPERSTLDFLGLNYYSRVHVESNLALLPSVPLRLFYEDRAGLGETDLGWEIYPRGLFELLVEMSQYGLPLFVTENGLDDRADSRRAAFLHDHLSALLDAVDAGADVRGYLHWSLLDNFEWIEGFEPRFGLYAVDYDDFTRAPRGSAAFFRQVARSHTLPRERPACRPSTGGGRTPVATTR